jgi:hypothetical protein
MKSTISFVAVCWIAALFGCRKENSTASSGTSSSTSTSSTTYYYQSGSTITQSSKTYYSTISDTSAVEVTGSGTYSLSYSRLWSTGSTTSTDSSSFYGLNAAVLATSGSTLTLSNDSISTTGTGGNGVFSYGTSVVTLNTDTINCTGGGGHGIYAAGGGILTATDVLATTSGSSSSVIATDRGGGTVTVSGGSYSASGTNSAALYSTGTINCTGTTLAASGAEAIVVEGANSATLKNCTIEASYNKWGALIYQSYSGDASGSAGALTITGGTFTYTGTSGGLFYNTNDSASIYLTGVTLVNSSDTLLKAILGSWGNSTGTIGGKALLVCSSQTISGLIYADGNSDVTVKLTNSSSFTGKINGGDAANYASVVMDASSTWSLTGNTYLSSLTDATTSYSNITTNGYKLYVNGAQVL